MRRCKGTSDILFGVEHRMSAGGAARLCAPKKYWPDELVLNVNYLKLSITEGRSKAVTSCKYVEERFQKCSKKE